MSAKSNKPDTTTPATSSAAGAGLPDEKKPLDDAIAAAAADNANEGAGDVVVKELTGGDNITVTGNLAVNGPITPAVSPEAVAAALAAGTVKVESIKEPTFEVTPDVVKGEKQVNAKSTAATNIIVQRIQRHMDFLNSQFRLDTEKARNEEQASFIETIGEALKQDYTRFELVADVLLDAVRRNHKLFNSGLAWRFMPPLEKLGYSPEALQGYKAYIQFLINVSKNWKRRHQLADIVDITYVIEGFPAKARENITQYFNKLASA